MEKERLGTRDPGTCVHVEKAVEVARFKAGDVLTDSLGRRRVGRCEGFNGYGMYVMELQRT
jgi:hypothetical protein